MILANQLMFLRCWLLVRAIDVSLRVGGVAKTQARLRWASRALGAPPVRRRKSPPDAQIAEVVEAVERSARSSVWPVSCLRQALAVCVLLQRRGFDASLRTGIRQDRAGRIHAHAWIESHGVVVSGGLESPAEYAAWRQPDV